MNNQDYTQRITPPRILLFFFISFGITWGFSALAAKDLLPFAVPDPVRNISGILSHYGPSLAAVILIAATGGRTAIKNFLGKLTYWRVGMGWYLFIFLFPLSVRLLAATIDVLLGGRWPSFMSAAGVPAGNPVLLIPVVFLAVFFQAGLAEEIGWRGYALPGLQNRCPALVSSLILGFFGGCGIFIP